MDSEVSTNSLRPKPSLRTQGLWRDSPFQPADAPSQHLLIRESLTTPSEMIREFEQR